MSDIKKETANATKWSTITEIASKCVTPIVNMVLARVLTPEAFGIVATVTVVVSFAEIFTDAGFQKYLIQHDFSNQKELDAHTNVAFWANFSLSVFLWLLIGIFSDKLAVLLGSPGTGKAIAIASASIPLAAFSSIQMARFKRDFDFRTLFFLRMISVCIPLFVTVPLALILKSYWALIIGTLLTNTINSISLTVCSKWKPKAFFDFYILKEMLSYSWWILLESISVWMSSYIGTFIVGLNLSAYYVGIYKTSMSTVNQIITLITAATSAPLFVALSKLKNDNRRMLDTYYCFIRGLSVFIIPMGVGIWLYRKLVTGILLGAQWTEASDFVGLWGLTSSIVLLLGTYCNGLYNAKGKTYLSFLSQILHLVVLIPVLIWASRESFEVLYIARCVIRIELIVVQMIIMKFSIKAQWWKLVKSTLPAMSCTIVMVLVAHLLQRLGSSIVWQFASVLICIIVYFACYFLIDKKQLWEALGLFGIKIKEEPKDIIGKD